MARPLGTPRESHGKDWVALTLAIGLAMAINAITIAVLIDALINGKQAGLSENATQILVATFGGIIGVLGGYIGYRAGERGAKELQEAKDEGLEDAGGGTGVTPDQPPPGPPSRPGGGAPDES